MAYAPVVGSSYRECCRTQATLCQGFEEGNAERCTLNGLSACADFVQQDQRLPVSFLPQRLQNDSNTRYRRIQGVPH